MTDFGRVPGARTEWFLSTLGLLLACAWVVGTFFLGVVVEVRWVWTAMRRILG